MVLWNHAEINALCPFYWLQMWLQMWNCVKSWKKTHPFSHLHRKNYCTCRARLMFHGSVGMSGWRHFPHFPPIHAGGLAVLLRPLHDTTRSIFGNNTRYISNSPLNHVFSGRFNEQKTSTKRQYIHQFLMLFWSCRWPCFRPSTPPKSRAYRPSLKKQIPTGPRVGTQRWWCIFGKKDFSKEKDELLKHYSVKVQRNPCVMVMKKKVTNSPLNIEL